ncbi:hypothetical protein ACLB2K_074801 [Fragaria x ananassa]
MLPLLKRKSRQEAFKRCYEQAVQQLGPRPANPPTVAAPPLESLSTLAPPIIKTADPPPMHLHPPSVKSDVIRNSVAMNQPTWWELKEEERLKLCTGLSICYEIKYNQKMYDWLMKVVNKTYTSWKAKLHKFFKHYKEEKALKEFVLGGRMDEWNWLKQHFLSSQFQVRYVILLEV